MSNSESGETTFTGSTHNNYDRPEPSRVYRLEDEEGQTMNDPFEGCADEGGDSAFFSAELSDPDLLSSCSDSASFCDSHCDLLDDSEGAAAVEPQSNDSGTGAAAAIMEPHPDDPSSNSDDYEDSTSSFFEETGGPMSNPLDMSLTSFSSTKLCAIPEHHHESIDEAIRQTLNKKTRQPQQGRQDMSFFSEDSDSSLDYTEKRQASLYEDSERIHEICPGDSDSTRETQAMNSCDTEDHDYFAAAKRKAQEFCTIRPKRSVLASGRRKSFSSLEDLSQKLQAQAPELVETVDPNKVSHNEPETKREYAFALSLGTALTFNMGFVNGACFSGFLVADVKQPVAGYTTPYTDWALELANGNYDRVLFQTLMLACFIGGSFISGVATPNAVPYRIEPTYGPCFLLSGICLIFSSFFAETEQYHNVVFYLAAAAGGVQNGISSAYTAKLIRSTGLTGSSTDIGLYFGQYVRGYKENKTKLLVLIILTVAFTLGGFISFYITQKFTTLTLLVSAGLFLLIGMSIMLFLVKKLSISFRSAMLGTWKWQAAAAGIKEVFADACPNLQMMTSTEIDEMFDRIDSDNSGTIDSEELYILLRSTGAKVSREESDTMLRYADKDGNGCLDREEWRNIVESVLRERKSMSEMTKNMVGTTVGITKNVAGATGRATKKAIGTSTRNLMAATQKVGSSTRNLLNSSKSLRSLGSNHSSKHESGHGQKQKRDKAKKVKQGDGSSSLQFASLSNEVSQSSSGPLVGQDETISEAFRSLSSRRQELVQDSTAGTSETDIDIGQQQHNQESQSTEDDNMKKKAAAGTDNKPHQEFEQKSSSDSHPSSDGQQEELRENRRKMLAAFQSERDALEQQRLEARKEKLKMKAARTAGNAGPGKNLKHTESCEW